MAEKRKPDKNMAKIGIKRIDRDAKDHRRSGGYTAVGLRASVGEIISLAI